MGEAPAASGSTGKDGTEDEGGGTGHEEVQTFRPGAILAVEGERLATRLTVVSGIVELSSGAHLLGRRGSGDVITGTGANRKSEVTVRAITSVTVSRGP